MNYYSVCWKCRHTIDSETDERCEICGWYICPECGACHQGGCVDPYSETLDERKYLRKKYSEMHPSRYDFPDWCKELITEKRQQDKEAARKARMEKERIAAEQAANDEALWKRIEEGTNVNHPMFHKGHVTKKYTSGKSRMISVYFAEIDDTKTFLFPNIFTDFNMQIAE